MRHVSSFPIVIIRTNAVYGKSEALNMFYYALFSISAVCLFKHAGAVFVVHLAGVGEEQSSHRFARVGGERHALVFLNAVVAQFQIIHAARLLLGKEGR